MQDPVEHLVQSASRGDAVALDQLLVRFLPELRAFVRLNVGGHLLAREAPEDIEQSVCREVLQDLSGFEYRGEAAFKRWLHLCALRKIRDRARFQQRARRDPAREEAAPSPSAADARYVDPLTPSEVAVGREEAARLQAAFDQLSEDHRAVVTMSRLLGMSHAEIGAELGRSEGAVAVLLHRALARLGLLLSGG